ncbi:hypothetical protein CYLTODRAFT_486329 [Cylindrobasidium torrendii FP15055 ss-10]|uniref:Mitochondrial import inner membrane translocase subunit TIM50 n=1 Tax=Cylindrobasidium torrendii FP15055 ss-10 TaxID=1314674 RepID=A0A0D7BQQ0_9AGAR|nr:hypothetical protein CYLTODRAFT_486329 [Cylindrobasidium torrendii FP15055 ss-10]
MSRKLIVLDLNGALLHRTKSSKGIRLRPHLDLFVAFIFHPTTRDWLDAMVWSSAQPQNVSRMVSSAFGKHETALLDVWTRDKMDLTPDAYKRKVQTVKDLRKVWAAFPQHSQATTILVDDSPAKARLQPYNQICLSEYVGGQPSSSSTLSLKKPRRKASSTQALPSVDALADQLLSSLQIKHRPHEDNTLLAIIGILSTLKDATDVAAEMENHHLFRGRPTLFEAQDRLNTEEYKPPPEAFWFLSPTLLSEWTEVGRTELERLGIRYPITSLGGKRSITEDRKPVHSKI